MKKLSLLLLVLISFNLWAQEDDLTIVAVGEAEVQIDKMYIPEAEYKTGITPANVKKLKELNDLIRDDFGFYIQFYEVDGAKQSIKDTDSLLSNGYKFSFETVFTKSGSTVQMSLDVVGLKDKKMIYSRKLDVDMSNIRTFGHTVADEIYQALTGKTSIFKTKILFVSDRAARKDGSTKELYIMDFDGKRSQRLTFKNGYILSPSFSPDNKKILYTIIEKKWEKLGGRMQRIRNPNLYLLDIATKKHRLISSEKGMNSGAIFDQSGQNIFLTLSFRRNADIYKINLKTKAKKRITSHHQNDVDPHINASGDLLTLLSGRAGKAMIYTLDPSGVEKNVKRISYVGRFNAAPKFSPDGKQIAFSSWVDNRFDIYRIDSTGRNLVRLTKNFGSNEEPFFSPDGQFVVFTSQRVISSKKATQDIYIMTADGKIVKRITHKLGKSYSPRWSN